MAKPQHHSASKMCRDSLRCAELIRAKPPCFYLRCHFPEGNLASLFSFSYKNPLEWMNFILLLTKPHCNTIFASFPAQTTLLPLCPLTFTVIQYVHLLASTPSIPLFVSGHSDHFAELNQTLGAIKQHSTVVAVGSCKSAV